MATLCVDALMLLSVGALAAFADAAADDKAAQGHAIHTLVDISHEFTFYFDGRFGAAYLKPLGGRDARHWATLSTADLTNYNLLLIHHGSSPCPYTDADVALVTRFVRAGGGLLLVGDYGVHRGEREFKLNTLAKAFGLEFVNEKPKGRLRWDVERAQAVFPPAAFPLPPSVVGQARGVLRWKDEGAWTPLMTDEESTAVAAVREFGKGRVAAVHGSGLFGDKPEEGDAPNAAWVQALLSWLSASKSVPPGTPLPARMPELEKQVRGLRVQYSSYLEPYADAITELYFKVAEQLHQIVGVPLSEGKNLNLILIPTGGGGFSSGVALGIGVFWGGFPEQRYGMIELIGHEATHSWVLPFGEPMWNEGIATYLGIEVGRRLGYRAEADKVRREWAQRCEIIDPDYARIDISQPEKPGLHDVYMAKPMWIWDRLREKHGDDIIARYFQAKRRLIKEGERNAYTADDCVAVLSIAAGEDLFGWFNSLGIKVSREKATISQTPAPNRALSAGSNPQPNEGATDHTLHLRASGDLRAVMIFVDFPDVPHSEATGDLYNLLVANSARWFAEVSDGRMALNVTPVHRWFRMPKASTAYGFSRQRPSLTFEEHRAYIADAITVSDNDVDYSQYKIVYIVAAQDAAIPQSPAFHVHPGDGITVDGVEIRHAVTFGADIRVRRPNYGSHVLIHETGHLLGLPDLYEWKAPTLHEAIRYVGGWDIMSFNTPGAHFLAWHRWKLGWLDANQIKWMESGQMEETLTPLEVAGGLKAIVVPTGPSTAYVVEVRQPMGQDSRLCDEGVLVYTVDATIPNGSGPIRVKPAQSGSEAAKIDRCGPLYDAPFDVGAGEVSKFEDTSVGLTVEVLSRAGSACRVRVTRRRGEK